MPKAHHIVHHTPTADLGPNIRYTILTSDNIYRLPRANTSQRFEVRQPDNNSKLGEGSAKTAAATQLLDLQDQLYDIIAANHFYYEAVESIMTRDNENIDRKTQHGWAITSAWLDSSQQNILQTIDDIRLALTNDDIEPQAEKKTTKTIIP